MNSFKIVSCVDLSKEESAPYKGPAVVMVNNSNDEFLLFFPVSKENADVISYVLGGNKDYNVNQDFLGLYKTMLDSWKSEDIYLSGVTFDTFYIPKAKKYLPVIRLVLVDNNGKVSSLVDVNFIHAILLASMEGAPFIISNESLDMMIPDEEEFKEGSKRENKLLVPPDDNIMKIARDILSGNIKRDDVQKSK